MKKVMDLEDKNLKKHIEEDSFMQYGQKRKPLQVKTVIQLIQGCNIFLLAATGFSKSRIPEMYLKMTTKHQSGRCIGVVVVLNPLDALGDDQLSKKIATGYSAINLTSPNFTHQAPVDLINGAFNFVYLSPKIFLNNKVFEDIYLSPDFQQKLVLVVVDEAHMIYNWGIAKTVAHSFI
jgi:superfamily II DNA helicase RecQ